MSDADELLERLRTGDESALNELATILYDDLHLIASRHLRRERAEHTLQTTGLVHEVYLKLAGERHRGFADRAHFLAVASRVMRQVLVDYARARSTKKRSGEGLIKVEPPDWERDLRVADASAAEPMKLLELDLALDALARQDPSLAKLVEMRYFGGMTAEETAAALGISVHVVRHDLRLAQAWLQREMSR